MNAMAARQRWGIGARLSLIAAPFLLLTLLAISTTLWVSWQLDGGAAALNEAGRLRMQAYRLAFALRATPDAPERAALVGQFEGTLRLLRAGDPWRPLLLPWDATVADRLAAVETGWVTYRTRWLDPQPRERAQVSVATANFVAIIDRLGTAIERHLSRWTALLHLLQVALMVLALASAVVLLYWGYRVVLEPLGLLERGIERVQGGDLATRVERVAEDEIGALADGFNGMAEHLQSMYRLLEAKVVERTAELEDKRERLEHLYAVAALAAGASSLDMLAQGFVQRLARIMHADGVALRWADQATRSHLLLASWGLPERMLQAERCIRIGACHCGAATRVTGIRVIAINAAPGTPLPYCADAGFETLVTIPARLDGRVVGELDLFFHAAVELSAAERSLLDALLQHLVMASENLRFKARETEAAVAEERTLLARELHDSIAQSLAFLGIQVELMREAVARGDAREMAELLEQIDTGVRESYADVRELLLHFRTRTTEEDISIALATTLRKFEQQSGVATTLNVHGHGLPLPPVQQLQVLHVIQEALSNVRKHARATRARIDVYHDPQWRFEVHDDGAGFSDGQVPDETHVGLLIMRERAERIGAHIEVVTNPAGGTCVRLELPTT